MAHLLCSPPDHLDLTHLLNEWMRWDEEVDRGLARAQWQDLVATLEEAGATVHVLPSDPGPRRSPSPATSACRWTAPCSG